MKKIEGKVALVTGASSGMGVEMARWLSRRGARVILAARRKERLEALARELEEAGGEAHVVVADLGAVGGAEALVTEVDALGLSVDILINNAGSALHRDLADATLEDALGQIQLNVVSLVELTHLFGVRMRERGSGWILNVSSIGAYLPVPGFATYAASKVFVRNFTEAIAYELAGAGVRVCCLCPGGIATEFFDVAGQELDWTKRLALMSPERCARIGLEALFGCRRNIVSGYSNRLGMLLLRFAPRRLMVWMAALLMGRPKALPA